MNRLFILDSISTINVNEKLFEIQYFGVYDGNKRAKGNDEIPIVEKIISNEGDSPLFPFVGVSLYVIKEGCGFEGGSCSLRCYNDIEIHYVSPQWNENISCDTTYSTKKSSIQELPNNSINIHQNSITKVWHIDGAKDIEHIEVINILGNILTNIHNTDMQSHLELNLSQYPIGTYILKIHTKTNQYFYKINKF